MSFIVETANTISVVNSRAAATLAAGAVFQGTSEDVSAYGRIGIAITSSNATDGTFVVEVSHDNVNWGGPPRSVVDTRFAQPVMWAVVEKYFRIKYTNGTTEANDLSIQVQYSTNDDILLAHPLDETLLDEMGAVLTRSVLVGATTGGIYQNVHTSGDGHMAIDVPLTAFGDLRVAELSPIQQISFEYTVTNADIGTVEVTNSGTVTQADAMCVVTTGTTTGSTAEWETTHNAKYRAGLGGLFRGTAMFTQGVAGTEQMLGIADIEGVSASHKNGYGVGYSGTEFGFMRWQNDVLFFTPLSSWDDPLDGTGKSGMTIDPTKLNVYFIQFQYLGAGAIKVWVEETIGGNVFVAHTENYTNANIVPSVYSPNFHLMLHVLNGATTSNIIAKSASMAYFIEGKSRYTELQQPHHTSERVTKTGVTNEIALFTIRSKALYAGYTNFIDFVLENFTASIEAGANNNLGSVRLVKNATIGGTPSYVDIETTDSVVDIDTAGTTVTGGETMYIIDLAGKNDKENSDLTPYEIILSPGDTVTVAGLSAASAVINGSLLWKELF